MLNSEDEKIFQNPELNLGEGSSSTEHDFEPKAVTGNDNRDQENLDMMEDAPKTMSSGRSSLSSDISVVPFDAEMQLGQQPTLLTTSHHSAVENTPELTRIATRFRQQRGGNPKFLNDSEFEFLREGVPIPSFVPNLDEYTVAFNGPDDPTHPFNWPFRKKMKNCFVALSATLVAAWTSSIFTPGVSFISEEFHVAEVVATLGLSFFVFGFATGPVVGGPLSEIYGRKIVLIVSAVGFTCFQFAIASAKDLQTILICRFFGSVVGANPLVVSPACFADMFSDRSRGVGLNFFSLMVFVVPIIAPVIGGFVANSYLGWRWTEYLSGILGGVELILLVFFLDETHHGAILSTKAENLRSMTGVWAIHSSHEESSLDFNQILHSNILRPIKMLFREPILFLLTFYCAFIYGILYMLLPAYPIIFGEGYGMKGGVMELPYLGIAIGMIAGGAFCCWSDLTRYIRALEANNNKPVPEARLFPMLFGSIVFPVGLFWFFWTGNYPDKVHWMLPTAAGVFTGFGLITIFTTSINYIVDSYVLLAASALAANTFLRSAWAAAFPLFAPFMLRNMGVNWSGVLLGCVGLVLLPVPFAFIRYGPTIRKKSKYAFE